MKKRLIALALMLSLVLSLGGMAVYASPFDDMGSNVQLSEDLYINDAHIRTYRPISDSEYYPEGYMGYRYPVRPGTAEWLALETHQDMVDACEIPEDVLAAMTTEELAQTVLAYPLAVDMFAYDNWSTGVDIITDHFNGLTEFSSRLDSASCLVDLYVEQKPVLKSELDKATIRAFETGENVTTDVGYEACDRIFRSLVLTTLLSQENYDKMLTAYDKATFSHATSERAEMVKRGELYVSGMNIEGMMDKEKERAVMASNADPKNPYGSFVTPVEPAEYKEHIKTSSTVYTPKASAVNVFLMEAARVWWAADGGKSANPYDVTDDFPSSYKTMMNQQYYAIYGINPVSPPTVKYNCHSYAWYQQSSSNPYWMDDPSRYWTDGSYIEIGRSSAVAGHKMVYFDTYLQAAHSAIIQQHADNPNSNPVRTFTVYSKWGAYGVYQHSWAACPYYYGTQQTIRFFR